MACADSVSLPSYESFVHGSETYELHIYLYIIYSIT